MTQDYKRFLQPDALSRISRLEIQARDVVEGFLTGHHRSPYFGQSIEFVQHREYVAGDDTRRIDWKAWSKTDKYYIKQYEEETNLRTTILLDRSESMQFGSGKTSKFDYGCSIASALSYLLLKQQDAVGMTLFDEKTQVRIPIRSQQNHLGSILTVLATQTPGEKTDLGKVLQQTGHEHRRRGLIVLISDLFGPREALFKGLKLLRFLGHDVMLFQTLDDQEIDFSFNGTTKFVGLEDAGEVTCDPKSLRVGYLEALEKFQDEIRRFCSAQMVDYQVVRTSSKLDAVLAHYMKHRLGMGVGKA